MKGCLFSFFFAIGFIFRLVYTQSTYFLERQHDVYGVNGHLDYILTIFYGEPLPDIIPYYSWQYYQPPLWHSLCAFVLKAQTAIGIDIMSAFENLQHISLFCSSSIMLLTHKLLKLFDVKGIPLVVSCAIISFHPTFIILSGSINNDILSIFLTLLSVILAIKWYREPTLKNIILLALSLGLAMGTKLSSGLVSVGIAMLFAIKLFGKNYTKKAKLLAEYISFCVICVPLALWWQIRNLVLFDIPMTYVPKLPETNTLYIGFRSISERFFDFSSLFDYGVYPAKLIESKMHIYDYYDYNIPLSLLKSSVFGEYHLGQNHILGVVFANILFYSAAFLALLSVIAAVYCIIVFLKKKDKNFQYSELLFITVCGITMLVSYLKFCFDYPFHCSMDFRYIAVTLIFGLLYIGLLLNERIKNNKMFDKLLFIAVITAGVLMTAGSIILYGTIV